MVADLSVTLHRLHLANLDNYRSLINAFNVMTTAVTTLHRGRLTPSLLGPLKLKRLIEQTSDQLYDWMPDYKIDLETVDEIYRRDSVLVLTDPRRAMLVYQIPLPIIRRNAKPMTLYSIDTIPVPVEISKRPGEEGHLIKEASYTQIIAPTPYIAFQGDYYVMLTSGMVDRCSRYQDDTKLRCPFHLVEIRKSRQSCMSAIYYGASSDDIYKLCDVNYLTKRLPNPKAIQVGEKVLLSGLQEPYQLKCQTESQPFEFKNLFFVTMNSSVFCNCDLTSRHAFIQRQFCMSSLPELPPVIEIDNPIAEIAFSQFEDPETNDEGEIDWSVDPITKINISQVMPSYGQDEVDEGVPLKELLAAMQVSAANFRPVTGTTKGPLVEFSWVSGNQGLWVTMGLGILGTLSWVAMIFACVRISSTNNLLTTLFMTKAKGAAAAACGDLHDIEKFSYQALFTLAVAIALYFLVWALRITWKKLGAVSAPRLTNPEFNSYPKISLYLEMTNGLYRAMLPVASIHSTLQHLTLPHNAIASFMELKRYLWGWHVVFIVSGTGPASINTGYLNLTLPQIAKVPLLLRNQVRKICADKPAMRLWAIDDYNIGYTLSAFKSTQPEASSTDPSSTTQTGNGQLAITQP